VKHIAEPWFEQIEKATKGRVKIEPYYASTLVKGPDEWEAVKAGVANLAMCVHGFWPGMTPLADVVTLPFLPFKSGEHASAVLWKLYEKFPSIRDEFKDNKILFLWCGDPYFLINSKKEIKTLEDIKGMKIRMLGGPATDAMKLLGGTPMMVSMFDTYINIQKGIVDGMANCWEALYSFRQYEVAKYYTTGVNLPLPYFSLPITWEVWNRMPPDVQEGLLSVSGLHGAKFFGKGWDDAEIPAREAVKAGGYEMIEYTLTPDEFARWQEVAGKPLWEKWVADREKEGHPEALEILDTTLELIKTLKP